jgi:hypothetical protein
MRAQQQIRLNIAPLTATLVLLAALALVGVAGYSIGANLRSTATIPPAQQVGPQFPAATQPPAREPQNSYD